MKKLLGIIIIGLIFVGNAYSDDIYSQDNRKKSEIKINCKINQIMKFANQDGLQASKYDTSDLPKMIDDPKLPGFSFCGTSIIPGRPYCEKHSNLAYTNTRES